MNEAIFGGILLASLKQYNSGEEALATGLVVGIFMALILAIVTIVRALIKKAKKTIQDSTINPSQTVRNSMKYCPRCGQEYDSTFTYCKEDGIYLKSLTDTKEAFHKSSEARTKNTSSTINKPNPKPSFGIGIRTAEPYMILGFVMVLIVIIIVSSLS